MRKILIVVDMQKDFIDGSLGTKEAQKIVPAVVKKIQSYPVSDIYKDGTPYVDEGNFVVLCKKMAAVPIEEAHFLDPEIKEKWYSGNDADNFHTMYVGEITDVLAR